VAAVATTLQPYELDEFLVWAVARGAAGRVNERDVARMLVALESPEARMRFAAGMLVGVAAGAHERLKEEINSTVQLVEEAVNWILAGYATVYDPVLFKRLLAALNAAPGTQQQARALEAVAVELRVRHPAVTEALNGLAEAIPLLEELAARLREPHVLRLVVGAIASEFGDVIGDVSADMASLTGRPQQQGELGGRLVGRFVMEVALFRVGI
jgi:hypothetical protein